MKLMVIHYKFVNVFEVNQLTNIVCLIGDLQIDFGATAVSVCPKFVVQDKERRDSKSLNVHPSVKVVPSITGMNHIQYSADKKIA